MLAYNWLFYYNSQLYLLSLFVVRTGFEPVRQAQQLGIVFINVGALPITVFPYQGTLT
jgi:hypothetical protein